jgi:hypothetical protein
MRIGPDQDPVGAPTTLPTRPRDTGFASALASVQDAELPVLSTIDTSGPPPAERWGQYGAGAWPGGYGTPPDPTSFADVPVGQNAPAHPLNPSGMTMDPPFRVVGYTGRGTPVPPGFYNLAYYNRYLAEGGTPLDGFPALDSGATIAATYGTFGDGRARATSFAVTPTDEMPGGCGDHPAAASTAASVATAAVAPDAPARTAVAPASAGTDAAAVPATGSAERAVAGDSSVPAAADDRAPAVLAQAAGGDGAAIAGDGTLAAPRLDVLAGNGDAIRGALRAELASLLGDLLRDV